MSMQQQPTADQVFRSAISVETSDRQLHEWYDKRVRELEAQVTGLTKKLSELEPNLKKVNK